MSRHLTESACRSCGASIVWARTVKGKLMPLDAVPSDVGTYRIDDDGIATHIGRVVVWEGDRFVPHWATCPQSDSHRKS